MEKRIDILIYEKGLSKSRNGAVNLIRSGRISANGKLIQKSSQKFDESVQIEVLGTEIPYVGRGGNKLEGALNDFKLDPAGLTVLDVGASTGGFTECLLRRGVKKVYAVDVGTNQLAELLINDNRVISLEKTDIRDLSTLPEKVDLAVVDVSFISLELVLEKIATLLNEKGKIIALVKPQFETARKEKNKSGVVKKSEDQEKSLEKIKNFSVKKGLKVLGETVSPILGGAGNKEYFLFLQKID